MFQKAFLVFLLLAVTTVVDGVLNDFKYSSQVWREVGQIGRNVGNKVDGLVGGAFRR